MYANENSVYMFNIDTNPMKMWDVPKKCILCLFICPSCLPSVTFYSHACYTLSRHSEVRLNSYPMIKFALKGKTNSRIG